MDSKSRNINCRALALATGLAILLAGCAAPDPHPFQSYAAAVKEAGDGLDQVLVQDTGWSRDKYIDGVLDGSVNIGHTAILERNRPFTVSFPVIDGLTNQPTFYKLQDVRVTLSGFSGAMQQYVTVLATLAGSDLVNPDTFETMAKDTDADLNSITKTLDAQVPGEAIPIFSMASSEIMRLVIEHRRHEALEAILIKSQTGMDAYCRKCLSLLTILDESLANDYNAKAVMLENEFSQIPREKRATDPNARKNVEDLLQLNSDYLALVHSLSAAKAIYEALPEGHRDLLKSVKKKPTDLAAIRSLFEEGERLKRIHDELKNPTAPSNTKG